LRAFIEENPHVYREEMVDFIAEEFDTDVSVATISRTLQKERISRKKVLFALGGNILLYC
jgi:arginine repressor